jgi:hypothetical protein
MESPFAYNYVDLGCRLRIQWPIVVQMVPVPVGVQLL